MTYLIVTILVSLAALFSGLTLGLLGLNLTELERKINLGDKNAAKIYPIRKKGNLLLCTLIIGNVAVNTALSIFLGSITSGILAGLIATGLIVVFGEILPQAVCARYALLIGAKTVWLVKIFLYLLFPITWPLSLLLDKILGKELPTVWTKKELAEIIKYHENSPISEVDSEEEKIVLGALSFSNKTAADIMTPQAVIFRLEKSNQVSRELLLEIKKHGFTRIPVIEGKVNNIVGIIYAKDLLGVPFGTAIADIYRKTNILVINPETKLDELLDGLIKARNHVAFVYNKYGDLLGLVTLEDVVEEIFQTEIVDESDNFVDLRAEARKKAERLFEKKD